MGDGRQQEAWGTGYLGLIVNHIVLPLQLELHRLGPTRHSKWSLAAQWVWADWLSEWFATCIDANVHGEGRDRLE